MKGLNPQRDKPEHESPSNNPQFPPSSIPHHQHQHRQQCWLQSAIINIEQWACGLPLPHQYARPTACHVQQQQHLQQQQQQRQQLQHSGSNHYKLTLEWRRRRTDGDGEPRRRRQIDLRNNKTWRDKRGNETRT